MRTLLVRNIQAASGFLKASGVTGLELREGRRRSGRKPVIDFPAAHVPDSAWLIMNGQIAIIETRGQVTLLTNQYLGFWIRLKSPS